MSSPPPASPGTTRTTTASASGVEGLVRSQYAEAADVYRGWWPGFEVPALRLLGTDDAAGPVSPCGPLRPGGAFYCPDDKAVYLDLGWVEDFSLRPRGAGATMAIVAHELGHAWQDQRAIVFSPADTVVAPELHADCLSGAVVAAVYADPLTVLRATEDAYASGDYNWENPQFHGTPAQRREATLAGTRGHSACEGYIR